jgi:hypothetical protein
MNETTMRHPDVTPYSTTLLEFEYPAIPTHLDNRFVINNLGIALSNVLCVLQNGVVTAEFTVSHVYSCCCWEF